jgi:CheY-like chemotaxis protein
LFGELTVFFRETQKRLGKKHIELSLLDLCAPANYVIITDKVKLKQIFINLIGNAFKFTDHGKIEAGCKKDASNNLVFYVSDTGIGIPIEKQKQIFDRFTQLNQGNNRLYGGTGLGLSIVKGLINLLGGEIWLESEPNKGTTFYFTLTYRISDNLQPEPISPRDHATYNFHNKTILIVEDDMYNAEFLKEVLADTGFSILHTLYGHEAIEISRSNNLDMVLMDISLPDMNGYDVTMQILQQKPNLKIIAQTAYAAPDDKQKAVDSGCVDYISKPLKREVLLSLIENHVSG